MKNIVILFAILILIGLGTAIILNMNKKNREFSKKVNNQEFINNSLINKKIDGFGSYDRSSRLAIIGIIVIISIILFIVKLAS
jgi:hypothetical protein